MLVLTRAVGERLIIGNGEVRLHVLEVRGNQVRLGIDAPRHIPVHREEIFQRISNKNNQEVLSDQPTEKIEEKIPEEVT
jgi:carbon storage regulator